MCNNYPITKLPIIFINMRAFRIKISRTMCNNYPITKLHIIFINIRALCWPNGAHLREISNVLFPGQNLLMIHAKYLGLTIFGENIVRFPSKALDKKKMQGQSSCQGYHLNTYWNYHIICYLSKMRMIFVKVFLIPALCCGGIIKSLGA